MSRLRLRQLERRPLLMNMGARHMKSVHVVGLNLDFPMNLKAIHTNRTELIG